MSKIRYEFEEEDLDNYIINRAVENITKDIRRMFTDDIWIKNYKVDKIIKQAGNSIVTTVLMAIYSQLFDDVDYKYYIAKLVKELRSE